MRLKQVSGRNLSYPVPTSLNNKTLKNEIETKHLATPQEPLSLLSITRLSRMRLKREN